LPLALSAPIERGPEDHCADRQKPYRPIHLLPAFICFVTGRVEHRSFLSGKDDIFRSRGPALQ
jgi:hypothetical protein